MSLTVWEAEAAQIVAVVPEAKSREAEIKKLVRAGLWPSGEDQTSGLQCRHHVFFVYDEKPCYGKCPECNKSLALWFEWWKDLK